MKKYKVCVYVASTTAHYIELDADSEESAEALALDKWYDHGESVFSSSKLLDETVEDTQIEDLEE